MNFSNKYLQFIIGYIAFSFSIIEGLGFLINNYGINSKLLDYTFFIIIVGFFGMIISQSKKIVQKSTKKVNIKGYLSYLNIGVTIIII